MVLANFIGFYRGKLLKAFNWKIDYPTELIFLFGGLKEAMSPSCYRCGFEYGHAFMF